VQQHLGRQDGVAKVEARLLDGQVIIYPKKDAKLDPARILKATYDSGVTVAEMTVIAGGWIEKTASGSFLFKTSADQEFEIKPASVSQEIQSLAESKGNVTVRARLYSKPAGKQKRQPGGPLQLEILEIEKK
jgi:hypothetical protein